MIDQTTGQPLYVSTDGDAGPYIMVPVVQLEEVRNLLDGNNVSYSADEEAISADGKAEVAVINLARRNNPAVVQSLLDSIP